MEIVGVIQSLKTVKDVLKTLHSLQVTVEVQAQLSELSRYLLDTLRDVGMPNCQFPVNNTLYQLKQAASTKITRTLAYNPGIHSDMLRNLMHTRMLPDHSSASAVPSSLSGPAPRCGRDRTVQKEEFRPGRPTSHIP